MTNQTQFSFETPKARLLFVVVPDDAAEFNIRDNKAFMFRQNEFIAFHLDNLPPVDWQLLGTGDLNEVTEEQAASVVETFFDDFTQETLFIGSDEGHIIFVYTSTEALKSLARSLGIPEDKKTIVLSDFKK